MSDDMSNKISRLETKVDALIQSNEEFKEEMRRSNAEFRNDMRNNLQDFKNEMRQQNEMRANEIAELRRKQDEQQAKHDADMKAMRAQHDADMKELRQDVKDISREVRNLFIAFVGIIVAIMIGMFWNSSIERNQQSKAQPQTQISQATEPMNKGVENDGR